MELGRSLQQKMAQAQEELTRTGRLVLRAPALVYGAECIIRFLLGGLLAGAEMFGGWAPFGLSLVGASGAGLGGLFALVGAGLGYLAFRGLVEGLRYVAAAILIFSVSFAFYDLPFFRKTWFMPLITALLSGVTGFVYLADSGWAPSQVIFFATELLLTGLACHCYRLLFARWQSRGDSVPFTQPQKVSLGLLVAGLLLSLTQFTLFSQLISVGRLAAVLAILVLAYEGGATIGAALGLAAGVCVDMAAGQLGPCTVAYGLSGLVAGLFAGQARLLPALAYSLTNALVVLWNWENGLYLSLLYEAFTAALLFILLPNYLLRQLSYLLVQEGDGQGSRRTVQHICNQIQATAQAFQGLYESLQANLSLSRGGEGDSAVIFDRTAQEICTQCPLRDSCWQVDYAATYHGLNSALPAMVERGTGLIGDFPQAFVNRCLHFPAFLHRANQELAGLMSHRHHLLQQEEHRSAVCQQYATLAQLLHKTAEQLTCPLSPDSKGEKQVKGHLTALGLEGEVCAYRDGRGHLQMEVEGRGITCLMEPGERRILSELLGTSLRPPVHVSLPRGDRLHFTQAEPLVALTAMAARQKEGERVSGDGATWFRTGEGILYLMLCDGMGSGAQAGQESGTAMALLEGFLRAGVEASTALHILNSALALQGEQVGGFTTVDLLQLDLFSGEGLLYKLGAAPTYLRQGGEVCQMTGGAFPLGLAKEVLAPEVISLSLEAGDMLLLLSDGLADEEDDLWLREELQQCKEENPKAFAQRLIDAQRPGSGVDDRTVVVLQLKGRGKS